MKTRIPIVVAVLLLSGSAGLFAAGYDTLIPLLVDLAGRQAGKPEGIDLREAGMQGVTVVREYSSGEKKLSAAIMLGAHAGVTWQSEYREGFKAETAEGSIEVAKLNGFLAYRVYNKGDASGGIVVLLIETVADTPETGAVFAFGFDGMSLEDGLKLAQKFDWKKMKEAAAKVK